jgi:hypothetical protein
MKIPPFQKQGRTSSAILRMVLTSGRHDPHGNAGHRWLWKAARGERLAGIENLSALSEWPIGFGSRGWDLRR